jgi:glycosyltransferase involved in cell wall biosynthesis
MGMDRPLARLRQAATILDVIARSGELVEAAIASEQPLRDVDPLIEAIHADEDAVTAIAAIHALARLPIPQADDHLAELLAIGAGWRSTHAAWALVGRRPDDRSIPALAGLVEAGGLGGMLAQRTLAGWAGRRPDPIVATLIHRLAGTTDPAARGRIVETVGLVSGMAPVLAVLAEDPSEPTEVRVAAVAALGDRLVPLPRPLVGLADGDGPLADAVRLALLDQRLGSRDVARLTDDRLRVAQVHLGSRLDPQLSHAGEGQTGGIATLLVQLGDALAQDPRVDTVTTIGRGPAAEAIAAMGASDDAHAVMPVPLLAHQGSSFADPWPARVAAERGLRRILRLRPADLLHLRMADVGSLAAFRIARRQHLPMTFTLAPDPHAVIAEMERVGELDRRSFGAADVRDGLWFRAWLVRRLADAAQQVVLFPRTRLRERLRSLLGIDVAVEPARFHVVPEGIDPAPVRVARAAVARAGADRPTGILADLSDAIEALGPDRQGLPIVVSVGRLVEVKGMARIAEVFAGHPELRRRANLVVIGGDLTDPSPEERAEIDRIEGLLADHPGLADALVLLGHRPHDDALRVMAAARWGLPPSIAPGGAYVSGSRKEEFGLAIVEALASGLPVVAPEAGGPASYIENGRTGRLVDTLDQQALGRAIVEALDLVDLPGRADRAVRLVDERYTVEAMAGALVPVYASARHVRALAFA